MKHIITLFGILAMSLPARSQDTTSSPPFVRGGIYDRPYLFRPAEQIAIGGYMEAMFRSDYVEGVHEGSGFEARRFNVFLFSPIADRIRLSSELEFEHGTEEIKLEMALLDIELYEALNVRGGILLSPIGKFNIAHDSPRNELTDRPLVSTRIIPSTLSEAGFGLFGTMYPIGENRLTYEAYLVNGLNDGVVLAGDGTSIPSGRPEAFDGDNNASPSVVGRVALMPEFGGELGFSAHTGKYNTFVEEGMTVDDKRGLTILALDGEFAVGGFVVQGELALASIELPTSLIGLYAERQQGYYLQVMYPFFRSLLPAFPHSTLSAAARYDDVDLDADISGDQNRRITVGVNLRLVPETVIKFDYQHNWIFDRLNNETRSAALQFGFATYF